MVATTRRVDLTDVKEGGQFRPKRKPAGDYRARIVKVEDHLKEGNEPGWVYTIQIDGDARSSYPYYVNPAPKQKWKIGRICAAAGIQAVGKRINFNPNKLVGKEIGVALDDDEYEGRLKSVIDEVFPVSEVGANANEDAPVDEIEDEEVDTDTPDDEEYEDEEPPPPVAPKRRTARAKVVVEEEPEDEEEEETPAPPPRKRIAKKAPPPPIEDEDDGEEYEDEEPDPTPPPRKRAPVKKTAPPARRRPAPAPVEQDDDLDDLETDDLED